MSACPKLVDLELLDQGRLDQATAQRIRVHLDSCERCRTAHARCCSARGDRSREASHLEEMPGPEVLDTVTQTSSAGRVARHLPTIEGYRITGILGQGGMGIVYQAVQTKLNRVVALKVLPAIVGTANPSAVKRFRREATAAARLHHTHIIPIYDFGESRDAYYYAMELIPGFPLNVLIHRLVEENVSTASPARLMTLLQTVAPGTPDLPRLARPDDSSADSTASTSGTSSTGRGRLY